MADETNVNEEMKNPQNNDSVNAQSKGEETPENAPAPEEAAKEEAAAEETVAEAEKAAETAVAQEGKSVAEEGAQSEVSQDEKFDLGLVNGMDEKALDVSLKAADTKTKIESGLTKYGDVPSALLWQTGALVTGGLTVNAVMDMRNTAKLDAAWENMVKHVVSDEKAMAGIKELPGAKELEALKAENLSAKEFSNRVKKFRSEYAADWTTETAMKELEQSARGGVEAYENAINKLIEGAKGDPEAIAKFKEGLLKGEISLDPSGNFKGAKGVVSIEKLALNQENVKALQTNYEKLIGNMNFSKNVELLSRDAQLLGDFAAAMEKGGAEGVAAAKKVAEQLGKLHGLSPAEVGKSMQGVDLNALSEAVKKSTVNAAKSSGKKVFSSALRMLATKQGIVGLSGVTLVFEYMAASNFAGAQELKKLLEQHEKITESANEILEPLGQYSRYSFADKKNLIDWAVEHSSNAKDIKFLQQVQNNAYDMAKVISDSGYNFLDGLNEIADNKDKSNKAELGRVLAKKVLPEISYYAEAPYLDMIKKKKENWEQSQADKEEILHQSDEKDEHGDPVKPEKPEKPEEQEEHTGNENGTTTPTDSNTERQQIIQKLQLIKEAIKAKADAGEITQEKAAELLKEADERIAMAQAGLDQEKQEDNGGNNANSEKTGDEAASLNSVNEVGSGNVGNGARIGGGSGRAGGGSGSGRGRYAAAGGGVGGSGGMQPDATRMLSGANAPVVDPVVTMQPSAQLTEEQQKALKKMEDDKNQGWFARNWQWLVGALAAVGLAVGTFFLIRRQKNKTKKANAEADNLKGQITDLKNQLNDLQQMENSGTGADLSASVESEGSTQEGVNNALSSAGSSVDTSNNTGSDVALLLNSGIQKD